MTLSAIYLDLIGMLSCLILYVLISIVDGEHRKNPNLQPEQRREALERAKTIRSFECDNSYAHCGFEGPVPYEHEPRTSYQVWCRQKPTTDLQQYTRTFLKAKVERYDG
jgi:DNA (cytosine-5)-methyltransferase 1